MLDEEYIIKNRQEAFGGELKQRIDSADQNELEMAIIKRFVIIEKSGFKGTYPYKHNKEVFELIFNRNYSRQINGRPYYDENHLLFKDTGNLESLEETVAYYEDIEKAYECLKNKCT